MTRKVLVTGASGLLGREIIKAFERAGWDAVGTALTRASPPAVVKLDLEDEEEIINTLNNVKPDIVVHSAANRFPDKCTQDPASAQRVNATATAILARETSRRTTLLLYISTDYVFSGAPGEAPYSPSATPGPTNAYGRTKLEGERAVLQNTKGPADGDVEASGEAGVGRDEGPTLGVVLRVPLLYGHVSAADDPSKSAVHALLDAVWKAQEVRKEEAKVKMDDYALRYPTCTEDVARACVDICTAYLRVFSATSEHMQSTMPGVGRLPRILHFSSEQRYTKFEMCAVLAEILARPTTCIERWDPSQEDARAAAEGRPVTVRPYDTHLDTQVLRDLGIDVSCLDFREWWRQELRAMGH